MEAWQLPTLHVEKCTGCGICEANCPTEAIRLDSQNQVPFFAVPQACSYCGICEEICPAGAVELEYTILRLTKNPPVKDGTFDDAQPV